jgi:hypothetical protein
VVVVVDPEVVVVDPLVVVVDPLVVVVGDPAWWQLEVPESVNVAPASGTKLQS